MIVVAGEALIDLIVHPDGRLAAVPGGGPFNTARTIARRGVPVAFLGRLSDDRFGRILRAALATDGVDLSLVEVTAAPTTLAIAELDDGGTATYRFHTAATSAPGLSGEAVRAAMATSPQALHVGTLGLVLDPMAQALIEGVARAAPATLVMLDPNCRPLVIPDRPVYLERLEAVLRRTDIVKLSRDDLAYLSPGVPAVEAARALLEGGPAAVLLTDGPNPLVCLTPRSTFETAVPKVTIVDTVGAGDAFGGAFLARWIERGFGRAEIGDQAALHDAVVHAIEVATLTCRRPGADPPRRDELPDGRRSRVSVP
jgi:fructokinase